jgi:chorismate synthase
MLYLTSGESHGKELNLIISKIPSGIKIHEDFINNELQRRQAGYGRGKRMQIETDRIEIVSGVRFGKTTGAPVTIKIINKDWINWQEKMSVIEKYNIDKLTLPRPGHADLSGLIKYNLDDIRNVLERSSARNTATEVAAGAFSKLVLQELGISAASHTVSIGKIKINKNYSYEDIQKIYDNSVLRCIDKTAEKKMIALIDKVKKNGDTVGGITEIIINGLIPGIGSYIQSSTKLDAALAAAVMSVQGIKAVEFGAGFKGAELTGAEFHDEFLLEKNCVCRKTNNAGGIEGGMSNGQNIVIRAFMKPIPTLMNALDSVDVKDNKLKKAIVERSDVCVVPAAGVVCESAAASCILNFVLEEFGYDNIDFIKKRYTDKKNYIKKKFKIRL